MNKKKLPNQFEFKEQPHFSLRKLAIGVVSVLLGTSIYLFQPNAQTVKADIVPDDPTTQVANNNLADSKQNTEKAQTINTKAISPEGQDKDSSVATAATSATDKTANKAEDTTNSNQAKEDTENNNAAATDNKSETENTANLTEKAKTVKTKSYTTKWNGLNAVYDDTSKTLSIPGGKVSDPKPIANNVDYANQIEHIKIIDKLVLNGDAVGLFGNLPNLTDITGLENLDTKYVTNMDYMFANDPKLTKLDLKPLNTSSVLSMNNMFSGSSSLTALDFSNFDTSKTQFMMHMFEGASSLTKLDLSSFDTNNVIDMSYMFHNASKLTDIKMSGKNWNAKNLELAMHMFDGCTSLENLDISALNTPKIVDLSYMFNNCTNLKTIKTGIIETPDLQYINSMFAGCKSLTGDVAIGFDLQKVIDLSSMFKDCSNIDSVTFDNLDPKKPIAVQFMNHMFDGCTNLTKVNGFENLVTHTITDTSYMFNNCTKLTGINLSGLDTSNVKYMNEMFNNASSIQKLDLSNFDVGNVKSMGYMFSGMTQLTDLKLTNWNPTNVIYLTHMFDGDSNLQKLDLSSFKAESVTDTSYMFNNCSSLSDIDLTNFNANNIQYFNSMFNNCKGLTKLDLTSFKTNNALDMSNMFNNCSNLTSLKIPNFDTSKVTDMQYMFFYDTNLKELDISNFDMTKVTSRMGMLSGLINLDVLKLGEKNQLAGTGLDTAKNWVRVGSGTITKPAGNKEYTSSELTKVYDGAKDADTYVHSSKTAANIIVEYQDLDDNGKVIATDTIKGLPGFIVAYQDTFNKKLADLKAKNYVYSAKDTTLPLTTDNDIQLPESVTNDTKFIIGLRHRKETFKAGEKNPFDQQNYDDKLTKTVTRTIHYSGSPENIPDQVQSATFKRNGIVDMMTGQLTYSDWDKDRETFKAVTSPKVPHYQVDKAEIAAATVTPDSTDIVEKVVYSPIGQVDYQFNFIDQDDGNKSIAQTIKQSLEQSEQMTATKTQEMKDILASLAAKHYKLVNDPFGANDTLAVNKDQTNFNFVFAHEKTTKKFTVKQNYQIKYVAEKGQNLKDSTSLNRFNNGFAVIYDYDLVTNKIAANPNIQITLPDNEQLAEKVPVINGYIADKNIITEKDITTSDSLNGLRQLITADWINEHQAGINNNDITLPDSVITVNYQKVGQIIPVDNKGNILGDAVSYVNDPNDPTKVLTEQKVPTVAGYTSEKTVIKPTDPVKDTKVVYTKNSDPVKPPVEPDKPPVDPTKPPVEPDKPPVDPTKPPVEPDKPPVDPTKPPVDPDKPPVDPTKPPVDPTKPPVDPTKPPVDPDKPPVDPTKPPVEPTKPPVEPDKPPVDPVKPPVEPVKPPVVPDKPNENNNANLDIIIHDDTIKQDLPDYHWNSGKVNKGDKVAYDWNTIKQQLIAHGYEIVNEPTIPAIYQNDAQTITIHVKHQIVTVSEDKPQIAGNKINAGNATWPSSDLYEKVGQYVVYFKDKQGKTLRKPVKQTMTFSRVLQIDAVTGAILNPDSAWQPEHNNYANVKVPKLAGYQRPKTSVNNSSLVDNYLLGPVATELDMQDTIIYQNAKIKQQNKFNNKSKHFPTATGHKETATKTKNLIANGKKIKVTKAEMLPQTNNDKLSGLELSLLGISMATLGMYIKPKRKKK